MLMTMIIDHRIEKVSAAVYIDRPNQSIFVAVIKLPVCSLGLGPMFLAQRVSIRFVESETVWSPCFRNCCSLSVPPSVSLSVCLFLFVCNVYRSRYRSVTR